MVGEREMYTERQKQSEKEWRYKSEPTYTFVGGCCTEFSPPSTTATHLIHSLSLCSRFLTFSSVLLHQGWAPPESLKSEALHQQYYIAFAYGVHAVTDVGGESEMSDGLLAHPNIFHSLFL